MPELAAAAASLNDLGDRFNEKWLARWTLNPKSIQPDSLMPRLLRGDEAPGQAADIAAYLATLHSRVSSPAALPPDATATNLIASGNKLFAELACIGCHRVPGDLALTNDLRVSLGHLSAKWRPGALEDFLRAPARNFPWTRMPDFKLTQAEAAQLAAYLIDCSKAASESTLTELSLVERAGNPRRGSNLVASLGCLSCHPLDNAQDRSAAPGLASLGKTDWNGGCMSDAAGLRGNAPDFEWTDQQRAGLRAFVRAGLMTCLERDAPEEFAERQYAALRCQACHARDNQTDLLTRLAAMTPKHKDTDEADAAGGSVHVGRPPLTFAGEKLYSGWMRRLLEGSLPYKPRPELQARMPAFAAYASGLAEGLANEHGYRAESAPQPAVDAQLAGIGQRLTGPAEGFSCVSCHNVGAQKALAGKDTATVNFACVAERLRPTYYWRYVQDPPHLLPGTMMPKFIAEDGTTPVKKIFNGDPKQQFTAIWHYLMSLRTAASTP